MRLTILSAAFTLAMAAQPLKFDVASVKPLPPVTPGQPTGPENIQARPGSLSMRNVRLRSCIKWAYGLKEFQLAGPEWLGAPGWLGPDVARYELVAKAADATPLPQLRLMLQTLLAERFQLTVHRESREVPSYALIVVKPGPNLHPSADQTGERKMIPQGAALTIQNTTIAEFAEWLSGPLGSPVLDMTNLSGRFDFKIDDSPYNLEKGDQQYAMIMAIQEQLGFKLDRRKSPVDTLVIDRLEKIPTEN